MKESTVIPGYVSCFFLHIALIS